MILTSILNHLQKSRKNQCRQSKHHQKKKKHKTTAEKTAQPPKHIRKNRETHRKNHLATKAQPKKNVEAQSSNPVQPPKQKKPPMIKKMVEPTTKGS
jgi:hypothetical protein